MSSTPTTRGQHLLKADRAFATGGGAFARMFARGFSFMLDRIDAGLARGAIDGVLPDGSKRRLGGRGPGPSVEVRLNNWRPLLRLATGGSVGWFKSWLEGEWESTDPVTLFQLFMLNRVSLGETGRAGGPARLINWAMHSLRDNDRTGAKRNIAFHYDLGNDFYAAWLDPGMTYSSAVFVEPIAETEALEAAQPRKIRLLLDRLGLKPGDRLLDIGCGWGSLTEIAARDYAVHVTGITLSDEQQAFCRVRLEDAGLSDRVDIRLCDYRDVQGRFDAVVSVEMVEAVGEKFWPDYLGAIHRVLRPGGRAALQLISIDGAIFEGYSRNADFIQTYIFPGGMLIEEGRFQALAERAGLAWQDRKGYGLHYAETLRRWRQKFDAALERGSLPKGFDPQFAALWRYYLMYCEGGFRGGGIDVAQVTLERGR